MCEESEEGAAAGLRQGHLCAELTGAGEGSSRLRQGGGLGFHCIVLGFQLLLFSYLECLTAGSILSLRDVMGGE